MKDQLSKNEIRGIFMRNGFTVKEGCEDLKDYVYAAAYDLLKAQEERHHTIEARLLSAESNLQKALGMYKIRTELNENQLKIIQKQTCALALLAGIQPTEEEVKAYSDRPIIHT